MDDISEEAYLESVLMLKKISTEEGFTASYDRVANYKRVFSRDGVISGLASLSTGDGELIKTFQDTLLTLKGNQDKTGRIPSNVTLNGSVSYGTTVGRVDATIWYIIGVSQYIINTGDKKMLKLYRDSLDRAVFYLSCVELNGRGFLYIPQGGDWADEYINRGYVLFDQLLYLFALMSYWAVTGNEAAQTKAKRLEKLILVNYFPDKKNSTSAYVYHPRLFELSMKSYNPPLPLPYFFSNQNTPHHVDNFANSLLLLSGLLRGKENEAIRKEVIKRCMPKDFPILPSFHPIIKKGDDGWKELTDNYRYGLRNKPYEYQNGGLWPLIQGFFLASMEREEGEKYLKRFAEILGRDGFIFPEFYHGKTFKPMGTKHLGFSAAGYIIAHNSIRKGVKPFI